MYDERLNHKFGVEIEFYNCRKEDVANVVHSFFENSNFIKMSDTRYEVWDGDNLWKVINDSSLHNEIDEFQPYDREFCGELVTPKLTIDDLKNLLSIVDELNRIGVKSDKEHGCAVHVHVDGEHLTYNDLMWLCKEHNLIYNDIKDAFNLSYLQTKKYSRNFPSDYLNRILSSTSYEDLKENWYSYKTDLKKRENIERGSKYRVINLHSLFEGRGVEYRYFKFYGKLDSSLLDNIVKYCLLLTNSYSEEYSTLPALLDGIDTDNILDKEKLLNQRGKFGCQIIKAEEEDLDEIYSLYEERVQWLSDNGVKQWSAYLRNHPKEEFSHLIEIKTLYKVVSDGEILGAFNLSKTDKKYWATDEYCYFLSRMVTKLGTSGIGCKIIDFCSRKGETNNRPKLRAHCTMNNEKLTDIIKGYGFVKVSEHQTEYNTFALIEKNCIG